MVYISADSRQIVQARLDGLSFSRLRPVIVGSLFEMRPNGSGSAIAVALPLPQVTRLAVRYINRLDLPGEHAELKDYFRTTPEVSPELPQTMNGFFLRVHPLEALGGQLLINQTIVPPVKPNTAAVVLDIDLFRDTDVPQDDNDIWDYFECLHERKNEVFEACITDRTRELIR